jgi:hypothetical protein
MLDQLPWYVASIPGTGNIQGHSIRRYPRDRSGALSGFLARFWVTPNGNMQAAMQLVMDRTLRAKETIQGHPLGPKQAVEVFVTKAVGNFRYLATVPWKWRDLDRLDRYWRQGYKTVWKLNESVADQPWTTPKNMGGISPGKRRRLHPSETHPPGN